MAATPLSRSKPIHVVQVITGLGPGGAERQLATLALNTDPAQVRHTVVSLLDEGAWGERLRHQGIAVHSLGLARKFTLPLAPFNIARQIRAADADLVQTWLYHADLVGLISAGLTRRPVIWTLRSSQILPGVASRQTRMLVPLLAKLSGWPQAVVANAQEGQRFHQSIGYRARQWRVIPNGIDCDYFRPDPHARAEIRQELNVPPDALLIGNLSRHDPWKDHPTLLAAFARQSSDAWLVLAGDDTGAENPRLDQQIAAAGADKTRILRLGRRSDMPRLNAALDLAVLSSVSEGFPNVIAEAMACGVPVAGTAVGDVATIVGDTGAVVPSRDPAALGDAIARLLATPPETRIALGQRARARIEAMFSVPAMVSAYRQLYEDILTARLGSRN